MYNINAFTTALVIAVVLINKVAAWGKFGNVTLRSVAKTRNLLIGAAFKLPLIESDRTYTNFHRYWMDH